MAVKFHQTILRVGNASTYASSTTWTDYAEIRALTPPQIEAEDIDATHAASANETREFVPGLADGGEVEMTILYDPTDSAALTTLFRQPKGFQIVYSGDTGWQFDGYIKAIGDEGELGDLWETTITIKVTGLPVPVAAEITGNSSSSSSSQS